MLAVRIAIFILVFVASTFAGEAKAQDRWRGFQVSSYIKVEDIPVLQSWNVNLVRFQLSWEGDQVHNATEAEYLAWLEEALDYLDYLLPYFADARIKVLLNLQRPPGGLGRLSSPHVYRIFMEEAWQTAFLNVWEIIAQRYASNSTIWGYDLVNEPANNPAYANAAIKNWNDLALETMNLIRSYDSNPDHAIVVEPPYGSQGKIKSFTSAFVAYMKANNVMISPHFYYPTPFTYQTGRTPKRYPTKKYNRKALLGNLKAIRRFASKHSELEVFIGEFAVACSAPRTSATKYLRDLIRIFESNGWHWTYHAFREADFWNLELDESCTEIAETTPAPLALVQSYLAQNTLP